jgi:small conductance mechanosensitive channel
LATIHLSDRQIDDFITKPVRIVVIIVVALVLRFLVRRAIRRVVLSTREGRVNRRLETLGERAPMLVDTSETATQRRRQRAMTIGTVLRSFSDAVITLIAVATILGEVGINLAPIIAGAGIVGIAVGFGAQNLVRDFISGLFLVIEDTYGVGDAVDLGPASGTVESIGLRSTRIRDVQGTLWSIRNGEISRVANYSQTWQRLVLDLLIPRGQDVDRARAVLQAEAERVSALPEWAGVVLEPPTVWGVQEVRREGVLLRLVVRRRPHYDAFDRVLREQLVKALEAAGVRIFLLPNEVRLLPDDGAAAGRPARVPTDTQVEGSRSTD